MTINWKKATVAERKAQASIVFELVGSESNLTLQAVFDEAFGRPFNAGIGYEKNFKDGKISRDKAALIYEWLNLKYPDRAAGLDSELHAPTSNWSEFIRRTGVCSGVEVDFHPQSREALKKQRMLRATERVLARRSDRQLQISQEDEDSRRQEFLSGHKFRIRHVKKPVEGQFAPPVFVVSLGSQFRFKLQSTVSGQVIALQRESAGWFPVTLSEGAPALIENDPAYLPSDSWLIEEEALGPREIAFIVGPELLLSPLFSDPQPDLPIRSAVLDSLAQKLSQSDAPYSVIRAFLKFTP